MSKVSIPISIITCPQWHARRPKSKITVIGASERIIIHHTAGHHPEISHPADESREEAIRYAQQIQAFHMAPGGLGAPGGGIDSGHNFLVTRNGLILQGRWRTVSAIEKGKMVHSAHCPGQNTQIGIEHEHLGHETMTDAQRLASATLIAWISAHYKRSAPLPLHPHREFFATDCPANLVAEIPRLSHMAAQILADT